MRGVARFGLLLFGGAVAVGLCAAPAQAAQSSYLELTCGTQGSIYGSSAVTSLGRENKIEVHEVHHLVREDPATARRVHEPFIFTKSVDRSTVNLYRALATGEGCTAIFRFYRPDPATGGEVQYRTITLGNVRITAIEPITADVQAPANINLPDRERVRMVYATITLDYSGEDIESYSISVN